MKLAESFVAAWHGLLHVIKSERNARIHLLAAALVVALCVALGVSNTDLAVIFFAVIIVFVAEITNTAVEKTLDLVAPDKDARVRTIKDMTAAAVLVAAIGAAAIGLVVFLAVFVELGVATLSPVIALMGPSGAGKTVQAQELARVRGWMTFSTGELIRNSDRGHSQGFGLAEQGILSEPKWVEQLVLGKIRELGPEEVLILDGSPRTLHEAQALDRELPGMGRQFVSAILIEVSRAASEERLHLRNRQGDRDQVAERRWQEYQTRTQPVLDFYQQQGRLRKVEGQGAVQEVLARINQVCDELHLA